MDFQGTLEHDQALAGLFSVAGRQGARVAGRVFGGIADDIRDELRSEHAGRGWSTRGESTEVWSRRGSGGPYDPTAYVFMRGGGARLEDHPDRPQPTLGPRADAVPDRAAEMIADGLAGLL